MNDNLLLAAIGLALVFPIVAAFAIAWLPGTRPRRKVLFVLTSVVITAGLSDLFGLGVMFATFVVSYFHPGWPEATHAILPTVLEISDDFAFYAGWPVEILLGLLVPVYLRWRIWDKLLSVFAKPGSQSA